MSEVYFKRNHSVLESPDVVAAGGNDIGRSEGWQSGCYYFIQVHHDTFLCSASLGQTEDYNMLIGDH